MSEAVSRMLRENMHPAQFLALVAPCLAPWQRAFIAKRMEEEAEAVKHRLLYGDPDSRSRPALTGVILAIAGARPRHIVFDEAADFDKGWHALALRKLHKERVLDALAAASLGVLS